MMRKTIILLCLILAPTLLEGKRIQVSDQEAFDLLQHSIDGILASGDTLADISISPGIYFFREGHLRFTEMDKPAFHLRISGPGAILTAMATGHEYHLDKGYVNLETGEAVDIREPVAKAGSWPIPVPFRRGVYMIRCHESDLDEDNAESWHIILSQWFKGAVYPVVKIRRGWLYFRKERDYGTRMWSELRYGRCLPRYILCHPPSQEGLHACGVSNFLTIQDSQLAELSLEGISFLGNMSGESLIRLDRVKAGKVSISDDRFVGIRSVVLSTEETDHLLVKDCLFKNDYLSSLYIGEGGVDISVRNNRFLDNGLMMSNAPVVYSAAKEYCIADNYFEDFSYSAIGVGIHYTRADRFGTSGIVEKNEICMSPSFRSGVPRALIDGGAIYVGTVNTKTVIRDNHVHDIQGPHGNRGIFADDGVINVEISGNRVFHVWNGYCIDLRRCFRVARKPRSKVPRPNVGNKVYDNVFDGRSRLFVRKDDPTSLLSNNVIIKDE